MNIHGLKNKLSELKHELSKGKYKIGDIKFYRLLRRKEKIKNKIEKLRRIRDKSKQ